MDKFPASPGRLGAGGDLKPTDLLRKKALGVHASGAPPPLAPPASVGLGTLGEDDENMGTVPQSSHEVVRPGAFALPKPRAPVSLGQWEAYWDKRVQVELPSRGGTFNVYVAGSEGPIVMCVHGGGYSGLTWSLVAKRLKDKYRVVAPDMRGHGLTTTDNDTDFSKETMSEDIIAVWEHMFGGAAGAGSAGNAQPAATAQEPGGAATQSVGTASQPAAPTAAAAAAAAPNGPPAGILVGHSMGGGLVVWAAAAKRIRRLEGVVVIDVVEGTALAALPHMMNILAARPASFASPEEAVAWAVRSGMSRNREAAAVSIPSQLVRKGDEGRQQWTWRTPLELSRPYWEGWYTGLSEAFLQLSCPKALLLAGTDRLDRALTIGQMQGKFQLILMPTAGHAIHEDEPDRAAEHLLGFLRRFRVGEPPLQFPRAPAGVRPVLPVVAGPALGGSTAKSASEGK